LYHCNSSNDGRRGKLQTITLIGAPRRVCANENVPQKSNDGWLVTIGGKLLTRIDTWTGFTVFTAFMALIGVGALQFVKTDVAAMSVAAIVLVAILAALFARFKEIE
jgi:hypothetical protein